MAIKNDYVYTGIEMLFTLIVMFLLLPLMRAGDINYYLIIFIFLSQRIKDLFFTKNYASNLLFKCWNIVDGIVCIAVFVISLSAMIPDVHNVFKNGILPVNYILMGYVVICLVKDIVKFIYLTIDGNRVSYDFKRKGKINTKVL